MLVEVTFDFSHGDSSGDGRVVFWRRLLAAQPDVPRKSGDDINEKTNVTHEKRFWDRLPSSLQEE
jgi:hypothetical protein